MATEENGKTLWSKVACGYVSTHLDSLKPVFRENAKENRN